MSAQEAAQAIQLAACLVLLAIPAFSFWILPPGFFESRAGAILRVRFRHALRAGAVLALLSATLGYFLSFRSLAAETGVDWTTLISETRSGHLFLLRTALLGAALAAAWKGGMRAVLIAAIPALCSLAWAGHAAAGRNSGCAIWADVVHLLSGGIWPATLVPLAICLGTRSQEIDIRIVIRRFSLCSLFAVAALSLSGVANAWFRLGSFQALFVTFYGNLLLGKIALFLAMIAIASRNLFFVSPRLPANAPKSLRELRRNIAAELALGTAILLITAALGLRSPH